MEKIKEQLREEETGALNIDHRVLNSFDENNLEKYNRLKLKERNLEVEQYETEYIDPFDGNRVKDITRPDEETGYEQVEDFITEPPAMRPEDAPPAVEAVQPSGEREEPAHAPLEEPVDQLDDEDALVQEDADSNIEAANLNKYDAQNLKERNLVVTRYETEYLDPEDGYEVKDIRDTHPFEAYRR